MDTKYVIKKVKANLEKKSSAYQDYMKKFMKQKGVNMKSMSKDLWKELGAGWKSKKEKAASKKKSINKKAAMGDFITIRKAITDFADDVNGAWPDRIEGKDLLSFIKESKEAEVNEELRDSIADLLEIAQKKLSDTADAVMEIVTLIEKKERK